MDTGQWRPGKVNFGLAACRWLCLCLAACGTSAEAKIALHEAFSGLTFERPLGVLPWPGTADHFIVLEQGGAIWRLSPGTAGSHHYMRTLLVDLNDQLHRQHNEEGLLSAAFHPNFPSTPTLYVYYSAPSPRRTVLARLTVANPSTAPQVSLTTLQAILDVPQPFGNHNGGTVLFGPDGMLYLSIGDGGSAGDPQNHAQNRSTLLGSIVRLNVSTEEPYAIPADNPFVGQADARGEIWAYGLRNVWRMSFDRQTGALWAADVGQNRWEEINIIQKGGNYGWSFREGSQVFRQGTAPANLIDPIFEYGRQQGVSITGGYVYRGQHLKSLQGQYIYGDFGSGTVWALAHANGKATTNTEIASGNLIASFGEDASGELLLTSFDGKIYRLLQPPASR